MKTRILFVTCLLSSAALALFGFHDKESKPRALARPTEESRAVSSPVSHPTPRPGLAVVKEASPNLEALKDLSVSQLAQSLAEQIGRPEVDYQKREHVLRTALSRRTTEDLEVLGLAVGQGQMTGLEARSALYLLSLAGDKAVPALRAITFGKGATATSEVGQRFALSLRVDALEQLEGLAADSSEAREAIQQASTKIESRSLRELARIASLGLQQGKPGKLHRLMEDSLKKNGG